MTIRVLFRPGTGAAFYVFAVLTSVILSVVTGRFAIAGVGRFSIIVCDEASSTIETMSIPAFNSRDLAIVPKPAFVAFL